jgi:hypothetical protein
MRVSVAWQSVQWPGVEHTVWSDADSLSADGVAVTDFPDVGPARSHYRVDADNEGRTRRVQMSVAVGPRSRRVDLRSDGAGHWSDRQRRPLPELDGCIDVDISSTPLTNTLPIRRLGLAIGDAADVSAVYVVMPSLAVSAFAQRYTRLDRDTYRYQSTGFQADLVVDEHLLVVDYPGLWRRLPASAPRQRAIHRRLAAFTSA